MYIFLIFKPKKVLGVASIGLRFLKKGQVNMNIKISKGESNE